MKPRWLLLGVSVICLLALFPAAALSQVPTLDAGCGTAKIDGVLDQREWANAGRVELSDRPTNGASPAEAPIDLPEVDASHQADEVSGELWVMNDATRFYMATTLTLDQARLHPDLWVGDWDILFTDEGKRLDGQWDAPDCWPLPGEGSVSTGAGAYRYPGPCRFDHFLPVSQKGPCSEQPLEQPLLGVRWAAEPDRSVVFEHAFNLNSSELDNVGPGDCFRLGLSIHAVGCEWGTYCDWPSGNWLWGYQIWPADLDGRTPFSFGQVCLDPCEEDFVPEPGSIVLLGSGLAGLAGYATLRWRGRE